MTVNPQLSADAIRLSRSGKAILLETGITQTDGIQTRDRLLLDEKTVERLLISLDEALLPHAAALRAQALKALSPAAAAAGARRGPVDAVPPLDRGGQLMALIDAHGLTYRTERSLRMTAGQLYDQRLLVTLDRTVAGGTAWDTVVAICTALRMPPSLLAQAAAMFDNPHYVHFGVEIGDAGLETYKLYFERHISAEQSQQAAAYAEPVLLYDALKWDGPGNAGVATRYLWYPGLRQDQMEARLAAIYGAAAAEDVATLRHILRQATARTDIANIRYIEVEEPGTARRSFDLNLYAAKFSVRAIQPYLEQIRDRQRIGPAAFQAYYDGIKLTSLGHVAGGIHRNGAAFFTLYYGGRPAGA